MDKIKKLRKEYLLAELDENTIDRDPFKEFDKWFHEAMNAELNEPNAMSLGTVSPDNKPSVRIVLLKEYDQNGFVFYTNYEGRKGKDLSTNPWAALNFFWPELQRQVRIEGKAEKLSSEKADEYFQSRPKGSQIGANTSPQSEIIANRQVLEIKYREIEKKYENKIIPRPQNWGGYLVKPFRIEFWQGRLSRLHDRILYEKQDNNEWKIFRLAP